MKTICLSNAPAFGPTLLGGRLAGSCLRAAAGITALFVLLVAATSLGRAQDPANVDMPGDPYLDYTGYQTGETAFFFTDVSPNVQSFHDSFSGDGGANAGGSFPLPPAYDAFPGDLVLLANPAAGDARSNWAAVVEFYNAADPTGSLGLEADLDQAFLPGQFGAAGFTNFALLPNVSYLTAIQSGADIDAVYSENGPNVALQGGQLGVYTLEVSVPEPGTYPSLIAGGVGLALAAYRRRRLKV